MSANDIRTPVWESERGVLEKHFLSPPKKTAPPSNKSHTSEPPNAYNHHSSPEDSKTKAFQMNRSRSSANGGPCRQSGPRADGSVGTLGPHTARSQCSMRRLLGLWFLVVVCGASSLVPCYRECDARLMSDEDIDVSCNETCKIEKCHEGCALFTKAISSSCHEVCNEERKIFNTKVNLYCTRGCNIAINIYLKAIEDEVGTPPEPYLVADTRTSSSITIKWAESAYQNISYLVQLRFDGANHLTDWEYYRPSSLLKENYLTVEDLHPYSKYRFRVAWIILENYPPLFSDESIVISTLAYGAPSSPPVITCLTAVSYSRVSINWDPPPFPNGPILSYVLYISKYPSGITMIKDISDTTDGLHYMINNLEPSTMYKIKLSTRNSMGEGPSDVRNITTLSKRDVSSMHHTPAYLLFGTKNSVMKQGLRILDEPHVIFKVHNVSISVTGLALHVKNYLFFVSDSQGNIYRVGLKKGPKPSTVILSGSNHPTILSVDWLHEKLYMAEETQISRCNIDGSDYQVVLTNVPYRPEDLHVDPLNGYLYMAVTDHISTGGLYRIDLMEFYSGSVPFNKTQLIVSDYELSAFVVDYKNFRLLLPSSTNNSIVSIALDGSDISDIRENSQTPLYKNIKSVAVHQDLLYYTTGSLLYGEEYHKKEDKFYNNVYFTNTGPFLSINIQHSDNQPYPIPLNPVASVQALFESDSARIRWSSPRLLAGQGKGAYQKWSYEVELHANALTVFGVNITQTAYNVYNLKPNTTYSIKVRAYSDGGKGPFSSEFVGTTLKSYSTKDKPYVLYGAREGLLKSDFTGQKVEPLILKMNLNNAYIIDICWYDKMLFINTNTTFVYVYANKSLTRLQNITMATSIAIDWFAPKLYYSSAATQMISRSNLDGSQPEPLPILTIAKEIVIDSLNAYLYWATEYSVERSRLNGMDHFVYMKNALFSGRMVMGLTLDFEKKKLYYMVRSYEGSIMYRSCLADIVGNTCIGEEPEIVGYLSEDGLHGPLRYFNNRIFWRHENQKAFVSDINGRNFAHIEGLGLSGLTSLEIRDSSLQAFPDGLNSKTIKVVPPAIKEDAIHVIGTHNTFNITWDPVSSLNYGTVYYQVKVDDGDEVYSLVTQDTVFIYPTMKRLPPFSTLTVGMQAFTFYATSKQTIVSLNSPMSIPSKPLQPRVFVTHKSSPLHDSDDITADFRWSPPSEPNGIILYYLVKCWMVENETKVLVLDNELVSGKVLQFQVSKLLPNCSYYFQVNAVTEAGAGEPTDAAEIETSVERPVPQLLLANLDSVKVADIDFHQEKLLFGKATHPAAIAYLAVEKTVFWIEEGALMVSSIDGRNASVIKHLTSEGTSLTVDWIARQLYWVEVEKKEGFSCVWSADLSYNSYENIFNSSSIIHSLEVEPFSRSLIWTSSSHSSWNLMMSDTSGKNIQPFFSQSVEYQTTTKTKVKRTKMLNTSCNCNGFESVGEAMAIDSTNVQELKILYVDGKLGHIWSSDIDGCRCQLLLNASSNSNSGLPPTSITVDNSNIYYSNKTLGKVYSIMKSKDNSNHINLHPNVEEEIRGIRTIRAIGHNLQPYPDASCLVSDSYENKAELVESASHSLVLFLPPMHRPKFCRSISFPSPLYTIYYGPTNEADTYLCLNKNERNLCKFLVTHNSTIVLSGLQPFTNYSMKVTLRNFYSKGLVPLGPEAIHQTAIGTPSPPMNVTAVAITPFRIDVLWDPPLIPNGDLVFFEIRWRVKDSRSTIQSECRKDSSSELSAEIITSETGKDHFITVRAYSSDCMLYSDSEEITVTSLDLPNNITLLNLTSSSLTLSWNSSDDYSISSCLIKYSEDEIKWLTTSPTTIDTSNSIEYIAVLEHLTPKTKYSCRLVLEFREKAIKFTWPQGNYFYFFTEGDVPGPPGLPVANGLARDVYQISWSDAINNGYSDVVYELQMRSETNLEEWMNVTTTSSNHYIIKNFSHNNAHYEFRVRAHNEFGPSNFSYSEKPFFIPEAKALIDAADDPFGIVIASSVVVLILLCVFTAAMYMIYLKKGKSKKILQDVIPSNQLVSDLELATLQDLPLHANFVHQTNALYNLNDLPTDEELLALPQIHRDQIIVTKFLGSGAFGEVFEGIACGISEDESSLKIAIKTLKKGATDHEKEEFLKEAKLMSNFKHDHILQLLGVCFDNNPNFIILELMEGGDLLSYLRSNRPTVFESSNLTMDDLIHICIDVAEGCKYLEDMHFVHRDLAARNCLVSSYDREQRIVKIGDFGLARDIYKNDYYRKEGEGLLPVRWMAPESLVYGVFSNESDVWSFGVLLWEVITLGMQPYPARSNMEVLYYVRAGGLLEKPENCPDDLHEIMLGCWSYDPESRPTFCYCLYALKEIRNRLASSPVSLPFVYNINYFNQRNLGFDNLGYSGSIMRTSIASSKSASSSATGSYIDRNHGETDENKLLDLNFDSRSTQSVPPTPSIIPFGANPSSLRRSLSWTSALFQSSDMSSTLKFSSKSKKLPNKYLELLGDNQDSDGYQLPLKRHKSLQNTFPVCERDIDLATNISYTQVSSSNHQASESDVSDCQSSSNLPSSHEQSSASNELDLILESFGEDRSTSLSTPDSNRSWLEDCDKWSFSTASTATCPLEFTLNSQINDIVSASPCIQEVILDSTTNSSIC